MGRYTDEFRASTILMLQAAGYPDRKGALTEVADKVRAPATTIRRWFLHISNPPPAELVNVKKDEIISLIKAEIWAAFQEMHSARPDAEYKELGTVIGILVDKMQLLEGEPTERSEHTITHEERSRAIIAIFDAARAREARQPSSIRSDD